MNGFLLPTDPPSGDAPPMQAPVKPRWHDAELRRAIRVAEQAGLKSYRIEIALDGTIMLWVMDPDAAVANGAMAAD